MKWLTVALAAVLLSGCGYADSLMAGARPTPLASALPESKGMCVINVALIPELYEAYVRNNNPLADEFRQSIKQMQDATGVYCTVNLSQLGQFSNQRIMLSLTYRVPA
jgi:hypothetical protein